ncbi:FG-GAP-like repeat-containing protein [uncultured Desulfuromonas sp.]|uniref:FG-GAP-like repeat-containing protein n=1 Tax=uncultured Desulfuromonas sp. TaxID=181013 RepID=UPI002621B6FD|nr:FG-GAP-like repeat-containing protein [uncultured Desulfuromonas sp.]
MSGSGRMVATAALIGLLALFLCSCLGRADLRPSGPDPSAVASNNRGVALMGQYDFEGALREFSSLALDYPDNGDILVNLAVATLNRQQEGDETEALSILSRVLQSRPGNLRALYCTGLLELHRGRPVEALSHFQTVVDADPEDLAAWYFRAQSLMDLSRHEEALGSFERVLAGDPYVVSAYYGAFRALRHLGKREEAEAMMGVFQGLKGNPRARSLEFKYRKMGSRSEAATIGAAPAVSALKPPGPVFGAPEPLGPDLTAGAWDGPQGGGRASLTFCDFNGDGHLDLFIAGALQIPGGASNAVLLRTAGEPGYRLDLQHSLALVPSVNFALWGDLDDDGLTDVYLGRRGPNQLWRQEAGRRWREVSAEGGAMGSFDTADGALFDADHDGDLDIFLVNADGPNELLNNNRNGTFRPLAADHGLAGTGGPSRSIVTADLDHDRDVDLIVVNEHPPHEVYLNDRQWEYRPAPGWDAFKASEVAAAVAGDADADGRVEIYALDRAGALTRWERSASSSWEGTPLEKTAFSRAPGETRLCLEDLDGDGVLDLLGSGPDGWWAAAPEGGATAALFAVPGAEADGLKAWGLMNSGEGPVLVGWTPGQKPQVWLAGSGRHPFVLLKLSGMTEPGSTWRSNASGIGNRLAIRVGARWTVAQTFRNGSGPGQSLQPVTAGLGGAERLDFVAIDWTDGVFQTELDLEAGALHEITETQRQMSSCPVLFVWDGSGYRFVSDLLGVGGMGYALGPGEYAPPRPWENFLLPQGLMQPEDGRFLLKLTEPMEEITYLDAVRLVAYDLPPGWAMTLDERMGIAPPEPTGRPLFYRQIVAPLRALNDRGEDVTEEVAAGDLRAAPPGPLDRRFIGRLEKEHVLTLTFAEALDAFPGQPVLLADGWVEYPYSQTNFAAWQAGAEYRAPSLDVRGPDGQWRPLLEQFGYPAGMPRQMTVPLPPLPEGARQIRIRTNQEIYWDRLAVAFTEPPPEIDRHPLPLDSGELRQVGFPERVAADQHRPEYDYGRRRPVWDTHFIEGFYTRFGPVTELVDRRDGAVAIFGAGEEIHFEFADSAPPARPGWSRVYVLETNGWCKDMDLHTQNGETVDPIPDYGVPSPEVRRLHDAYQTRYLSGRQ